MMSDALSVELSQITVFSPGQLSQFLAVVALELTISGRETYVPESIEVADPAKLREFNECLHFIAGILRRTLFDEQVDIVSLIETLGSVCSDNYIGGAMQAAVRRAMRQVRES